MKTKASKKISPELKLKIKLYIMSLWLLFFLIFLLTVDVPISFNKSARFIGWSALLRRNWLALIALIMTAIGLYFTRTIHRKDTGTNNPPVKIVSVKNENYEYLTFLTTYIIPLICIDLSEIRYVILLGVLLVLIGYIFIKMDLYYGNPTLALMGYRLYRAEINGYSDPDGIVLISKNRLSVGKSIKWIPIDENVWLAKEINNGD